jgi:hypothetical protein
MTVDECEQLLERLRNEEAEKTHANVARMERDRAAAQAARDTEEARLLAAWVAHQKQIRIKLNVPDRVDPPTEFFGHERGFIDHHGKAVRGADPVLGDIEKGKRVIYVRSWHDFRILLQTSKALEWQRANGEAMAKMAEVMPRNNAPLPPDAPAQPRF